MRLYAHIGWPKTGTSAIQSYLDTNRTVLAKDFRILYPNFGSYLVDEGQYLNHYTLVLDRMKYNIWKMNESITYARRKNYHTIILSIENPTSHHFRSVVAKTMAMHKIDVYVIAYLRRQDHFVESSWRQWGIKAQKCRDIEEFCDIAVNNPQSIKNWSQHLGYLRCLNSWGNIVGSSNIIVRPYEKGQLHDGDAISDFLSLFGIDRGFPFVELSSDNINPGLHTQAMAILQKARGIFRNEHDTTPFDLFFEAIADNIIKGAFQAYDLLSPHNRMRILRKYCIQNRLVARKYLPHSDGNLFHEPIPNEEELWRPQPVDIESYTSIFTQIIVYLYQRQICHENITQKLQMTVSSAEDCRLSSTWLQCVTPIITISPETLIFDSSDMNNIQIFLAEDGGVSMLAYGPDPYLTLPPVDDVNQHILVLVEITVPDHTIVEMFYDTEGEPFYDEARKISRNARRGRNVLFLEIISKEPIRGLRLDPGHIPGQYVLHSIELRSAAVDVRCPRPETFFEDEPRWFFK
jgi:hypothetical protein